MEDNRKGEAAETKKSSQIIKIEEEKLHNHLDEVVRGTVEETLNALLEAEAEVLCGARRYECPLGCQDTRTGPRLPV